VSVDGFEVWVATRGGGLIFPTNDAVAPRAARTTGDSLLLLQPDGRCAPRLVSLPWRWVAEGKMNMGTPAYRYLHPQESAGARERQTGQSVAALPSWNTRLVIGLRLRNTERC